MPPVLDDSPWFLILAENPFSRFDLQSLDYCPQDGGFLSSMQAFSNQDYLEKKTVPRRVALSNIILSQC